MGGTGGVTRIEAYVIMRIVDNEYSVFKLEVLAYNLKQTKKNKYKRGTCWSDVHAAASPIAWTRKEKFLETEKKINK